MSFLARLVVLELLLVAVLTWMLERSFSPVVPYDAVVEQALRKLELAEADLRSNVLAARAGVLGDYDPLVADAEAMRREAAVLGASDVGGGERGRALIALIEGKEVLLEQFKSQNAILQNALATTDLLSARLVRSRVDPNLALAAGSLASIVSHMSRQPDTDVGGTAMFWVDALANQRFATSDEAEVPASLARHGRMLVALLPEVDSLLGRLQAISLTPETDAMSADLRGRRLHQQQVSAQFHWALYGTAILVSALLLRAGFGLRSRTRALQTRVHMDSTIVKASNLFVACPPEQINARVDEALAMFGTAKGADRAYMLSRDLTRMRLWMRLGVPEPTDWPSSRKSLPDLVGHRFGRLLRVQAGDEGVLGPLARTLRNEGMESIACVSFGRGVVPLGVLAFERSTPSDENLTEDEISLELMAEVLSGAAFRRDSAERRRDLERKLRRAERMQHVGTFASGIAHNFNNVLGTIVGQAELAAGVKDVSPAVARHVREIAEAGQHARDLTGRILSFGRCEQRAPKVLEVSTIVSEAINHVGLAARGTANLVTSHLAGAARVLADPTQILQVLVNLIQNAVQAGADGSPVVVEADHVSSPGERLSHGRVEAGPFVRISVSDSGRGMSAEEARRMFEPFFTTRTEGTGLGLATARDAVGDVGGGFDVTSVPGRGTKVVMWLPEFTATPEAPCRGGIVLLLGVDRVAVERDEDLLAALGYEPVGFVGFEAALHTLRSNPDRFDVVIVDEQILRDGDVSQLQTLRNSLLRDQPILLSLPEGDPAIADQVSGIAAVLVRPWMSSGVADSLSRVLGET